MGESGSTGSQRPATGENGTVTRTQGAAIESRRLRATVFESVTDQVAALLERGLIKQRKRQQPCDSGYQRSVRLCSPQLLRWGRTGTPGSRRSRAVRAYFASPLERRSAAACAHATRLQASACSRPQSPVPPRRLPRAAQREASPAKLIASVFVDGAESWSGFDAFPRVVRSPSSSDRPAFRVHR